jgi:hypothetical protein
MTKKQQQLTQNQDTPTIATKRDFAQNFRYTNRRLQATDFQPTIQALARC